MLSNCQTFITRKAITSNVLTTQRRWKNKKDHWSVVSRKKTSSDRALEHFDDFYTKVFNRKWPSVRLGLLSENKYCAIVNNYSDSERTTQELERIGAIDVNSLIKAQSSHIDSVTWKQSLEKVKKMNVEPSPDETIKKDLHLSEATKIGIDTKSESPVSDSNRLILPAELGGPDSGSALYDFVPATRLKGMEDYVLESQHYSYYKTDGDFSESVQTETEDRLIFPEALRVYTFESGNISRFPKPRRGSTGVTDYYLLDGSSILPVLCLGLQSGDRVLDMCSAPGGKSLLCLQTLLTDKVVSNDSSFSRLNRLKRVFNEFFYDLPKMEKNEEIVITNADAREASHLGKFNKILVDVPCTVDRYSVRNDDNNIFRPDRVKERIKLPELQTDILIAALKMVEDGGTVVYSTCSLSPVQNDGVVKMALERIWQETDHNIIVKDMKRVLAPFHVLYKFADIGLHYGHLVLPYLPSNFGPMYFCKFVKRNKI